MRSVQIVTVCFWACVAWGGCSDDSTGTDSAVADATLDKSIAFDSAEDQAVADASPSPVTIVGTNQTASPVYVDWKWGARGYLTCGIQNGAAWDTCSFFSPACMAPCGDSNKDMPCCMACEQPMASVKKLGPGDSVSATWTGEAWNTVLDHCADSCACYWVIPPQSGHYRAEICVYDAYTCNSTPCPDPNQDGVVAGASPSGTKRCFSTELDVPYAGSLVEIAFQ